MNRSPLSWLLPLALMTFTCAATSQGEVELVRGESLIEVPAVGEGLCVHNLFQSNMVLQRDKPIAVWGWASPGETVTVSLAGNKATTTAQDDRRWKVALPPLPAHSEPITMTIQGKDRTLTLDNILVGDVWVLGGQSNMEHPIARVEGGRLEIASANFPHIRILTVPFAAGPEHVRSFPSLFEWNDWFKTHARKGYWDACSPDTVKDLSAIGYIFARRLHMATQIPIGVIDASVGGTTIETWVPDSDLRGIDHPAVNAKLDEWDAKVAAYDPQKALEEHVAAFNARTDKLKAEGKDVSGRTPPTEPPPTPAVNINRPGNGYAGMIVPLKGFTVKGVIWHQGYSNCFDGTRGAVLYEQLFPVMINAWRTALENPDAAFGIISLCTQGKTQTREDFTESMLDAGPYVREAQYKTFLKFIDGGDDNIGYTSTYDLRRRWYHPGLKIPAGERIAQWALVTQYNMDHMKWRPPRLTGMTAEAGRLVLQFDSHVAAVDDGLPIEGFAIAGEDRLFHPADAAYLVTGQAENGRDAVDNKTLVLTSPMVPHPIHFRYAWARSPMGNAILGGAGDIIPLGTQRSDDWPMEHTPAGLFGDDPPAQLDRAQMARLRQVLRAEDLRRRITEAKALLREQSDQGGQSFSNKSE